MLKDIARVLQLLNTVVVEQLQGSVDAAGEGLDGSLAIGRVLLKTANAEGLTFQDLRLGLQDLRLPSKEDRSVSATVRVDHMELLIAPAFYERAAAFAKEKLIKQAYKLVDRVVLDNLQVKVDVSAEKKIDVEVYLEKVQVMLGDQVAQIVENVRLRLEDFVPGPDKKAALAASRLYLYNLQVRVAETFLNNATDVVRGKLPSMVEDVSMNLGGGKLAATAKVKVGLTLTGTAVLEFRTKRNNFGIQFAKITGVPMAGKLVPWVASTLASKLPDGIETSSDTIWINPWKKIPIPITCVVERFTVENNQIVLEFVPPPEAPPLHLVRRPEPVEATASASNDSWTSFGGYLPPLP